MPLQYVRDDARRRIRLTLTDPLSVAELIASVERQYTDGAWRYGLLVDMRTPFPASRPIDDVRVFVAGVRELVAAHGPRGPIAVVAREAAEISTAQMYILLGGTTEPMDVFWDLDSAQQWLEVRMAEQAREPPASA